MKNISASNEHRLVFVLKWLYAYHFVYRPVLLLTETASYKEARNKNSCMLFLNYSCFQIPLTLRCQNIFNNVDDSFKFILNNISSGHQA